MKFNRMKALSILVLSTVISNVAFAESMTKIYKTFDGSVAYCGIENSIQSPQGGKNILIETVKQTQTEDESKTTLKVSLVKCDGNKWILDSNPTFEKYRAFNGETVEVEYKDFQIMIVDKHHEVVQFEMMEQLKQKGQSIISVDIETANEPQDDREIIVAAKKTIRSSGGYSETTRESFGSFNLRILK